MGALGTAQVRGLDSSSLSPSADVVAGGRDRWQMLAEGKNSDQLVDVLLEIGEGLLQEKDFFPGLVGESLGSGGLGPESEWPEVFLLLRRLEVLGELSGALPCLLVGLQRGPEIS